MMSAVYSVHLAWSDDAVPAAFRTMDFGTLRTA
jgi:hypothetical protein